MIDVKAILARADAATKGPWENTGSGIYAPEEQTIRHADGGAPSLARAWPTEADRHGPGCILSGTQDANAAFIAAAREDVPALCAEVERVTTLANANAQKCSDLADENARLRGLLREARGTHGDPCSSDDCDFKARIDAALGESK